MSDDDHHLRMVLARNVRRLRRHRKLTQPQLAGRCRPKLSPRTILAIEKGEHSAVLDTVEILARALGKPVEALLYDPDSHSTTTRYLRILMAGASAHARKAIVAYARGLSNPPDTTSPA